jgi:DNA-binding XRE family transcriptional regulator
MPLRSLTDLDHALRKDPAYETALQELTPYEEIARQLISSRVEHGLLQTELARRSGVSRGAIARLERGEHEPQLATLRRIARALDADLVVKFVFRSRTRRTHPAPL